MAEKILAHTHTHTHTHARTHTHTHIWKVRPVTLPCSLACEGNYMVEKGTRIRNGHVIQTNSAQKIFRLGLWQLLQKLQLLLDLVN